MNINTMFPSKYVAARDLSGVEVPVEMARVTQESMPEGETRPVVYFAGMQKGLVLNRTNAKRIEAVYGSETNSWIGASIVLYPSETEYKGDTVPCIRVRIEGAPAQQAAPAPLVAPPPAVDPTPRPHVQPPQPQLAVGSPVRF